VIDLNKTINEQKEILDGDINILITLKGSGKSYFMEQEMLKILRDTNDNFAIFRMNQINIQKAVINPIIQLLAQNNLLYHGKKRTKNKCFSVDLQGIKEIGTGIYRCLFGYMSSPTALDGCNLKAKTIFFDEFLMIERRGIEQQDIVYQIQKDLVENFWRMVNTLTRPNKPKIYMFANPHTPTCLNSSLITNKAYKFDIDWDKLKYGHIQEDTKNIKFANDIYTAKIWVVPIDFNTMNTKSNDLMNALTGNNLFKFAGNDEKFIEPYKPHGFKFQFNYSYKGELMSFFEKDNEWWIGKTTNDLLKEISYTHDEIYKTNKHITLLKDSGDIIQLFNNIINAKHLGEKFYYEDEFKKNWFDKLYLEIRKNGEYI